MRVSMRVHAREHAMRTDVHARMTVLTCRELGNDDATFGLRACRNMSTQIMRVRRTVSRAASSSLGLLVRHQMTS